MKEVNELLNKLTHREKQVFIFLINGYTSKQIGCELDLAEPTIKHFITNILNKFNVENRTQITTFFYKSFIKKIASGYFQDPVQAASQFLQIIERE